MKKINVKTETYELDSNFRVDVTTEGNSAEAWIYNTEYGIKTLIFTINLKENNQTMEDFMAMVENSLDEEIEFYTKEYAL